MAIPFVCYLPYGQLNDDGAATVVARRIPVCTDTAQLSRREHTVEDQGKI